MTYFLFPDNTVLCNFAAVDRLDVLETALNGRGRWAEAVAEEAHKSSHLLPPLTGLQEAGWLRDPIEVDDERDVMQIERIRRAVFGGTDERPLQHLGEAQTCHLLLGWPEFAGSWWVSDDRDALDYARHRGITTRETIDLVSGAVSYGDLDAQDGYALLHAMAQRGRHLRLPKSVQELLR